MTKVFTNLDNELKIIQLEKILLHNRKFKESDGVIYDVFDKNELRNKTVLVDTSTFLTSKDFSDYDIITENSEIELENQLEANKETTIDLFLEQLELYYLIYKLPLFDIKMKKFLYFLNILYDYIIENNKGNFFYLASVVNRYVLADALINQKKSIIFSDYIDKLKYLIPLGFSKNDLENIKNKLNYSKVIEFQNIKKKI